MKEMSGNV